jgi:hypothetical protein
MSMWELLLDELHLSQLFCSCSITYFPIHQLGDGQSEKASETGSTRGSTVTIGATNTREVGTKEGGGRGEGYGHTTE